MVPHLSIFLWFWNKNSLSPQRLPANFSYPSPQPRPKRSQTGRSTLSTSTNWCQWSPTVVLQMLYDIYKYSMRCLFQRFFSEDRGTRPMLPIFVIYIFAILKKTSIRAIQTWALQRAVAERAKEVKTSHVCWGNCGRAYKFVDWCVLADRQWVSFSNYKMRYCSCIRSFFPCMCLGVTERSHIISEFIRLWNAL